jgi:hypothetical protein
MNDAHFLRKQLIIVGFFIPAGYALIFFPFAIMAAISILTRPLYGVAAFLAFASYIILGIIAWRRPRLIWTLLFFLVSLSPLLGQFVVLPEIQKRHFREYRQIPSDAKIVYYREAGLRDVTRFCLIQHPPSKNAWQFTSVYRPFLPGALGIMRNVQRELGISDSKMPNPDKARVSYTGGENEVHADGWMFLDVVDTETKREWIFEYGY